MAGARWYASERSGMVSGGNERSLLAGADLLLHTRPIPEQVQVEHGGESVMSIDVMETIVRMLEKIVDRGRIDEKLAEAAAGSKPLRNVLAILDASYARIERLRDAAARPEPRAPGAHGKVIALNSYPSVPSVYRTVAEHAITPHGPQEPPGAHVLRLFLDPGSGRLGRIPRQLFQQFGPRVPPLMGKRR